MWRALGQKGHGRGIDSRARYPVLRSPFSTVPIPGLTHSSPECPQDTRGARLGGKNAYLAGQLKFSSELHSAALWLAWRLEAIGRGIQPIAGGTSDATDSTIATSIRTSPATSTTASSQVGWSEWCDWWDAEMASPIHVCVATIRLPGECVRPAAGGNVPEPPD